MIVKELQRKLVRYIYRKTIATDMLFIVVNKMIYFQMDAGEFDGILYTILSE